MVGQRPELGDIVVVRWLVSKAIVAPDMAWWRCTVAG